MACPAVTVLVPAFNYEKYVCDAIDSVLFQEGVQDGDVEIIVLDDGSSDETVVRCGKYSCRIRYVYTKNRGVSHALSLGVSLSRGKYIAILSSDDYWLPYKLRRVIVVMESDPRIVFAGHLSLRKRGDTEYKTYVPLAGVSMIDEIDTPHKFGEYMRGDFLQGSAGVFRGDVLRKIMPIPAGVQFFNDQYLTHSVIFYGKVALLPEYLGVYRMHAANYYTRAVSREKLRGLYMSLQELVRGVLGHIKRIGKANTEIALCLKGIYACELGYARACALNNSLQAFRYSIVRTLRYNCGAPLWKRLYLCLSNAPILISGIMHYIRWQQGIDSRAVWYMEAAKKLVRLFKG